MPMTKSSSVRCHWQKRVSADQSRHGRQTELPPCPSPLPLHDVVGVVTESVLLYRTDVVTNGGFTTSNSSIRLRT